MKKNLINSYRLVLIALVVALWGCGGDEPPTPTPPTPLTDEQIISQAGWRLESVTFNGQAQNASQFSLKFNGDKSYAFTVPGIPNLTPSGNWSYSKDPTKEITLSGGIKMKVTDLRETRMVLEHTYKNHKEGDVVVIFTYLKP